MELKGIKQQYKIHKTEIDSAIWDVLDNADFINGSQVKQIEYKKNKKKND